jgi:hypothetical protein
MRARSTIAVPFRFSRLTEITWGRRNARAHRLAKTLRTSLFRFLMCDASAVIHNKVTNVRVTASASALSNPQTAPLAIAVAQNRRNER